MKTFYICNANLHIPAAMCDISHNAAPLADEIITPNLESPRYSSWTFSNGVGTARRFNHSVSLPKAQCLQRSVEPAHSSRNALEDDAMSDSRSLQETMHGEADQTADNTVEQRSDERVADNVGWETKVLQRVRARMDELTKQLGDSVDTCHFSWESRTLQILRERLQATPEVVDAPR
jgi:hypothetical protein